MNLIYLLSKIFLLDYIDFGLNNIEVVSFIISFANMKMNIHCNRFPYNASYLSPSLRAMNGFVLFQHYFCET